MGIAAGVVVLAGGATVLALAIGVLSLIQRILARSIGGDMNVRRTVIDIHRLRVSIVVDSHCRPVRRMRDLVPAFLDPMQAQRRHEGDAEAGAKGAQQARQG